MSALDPMGKTRAPAYPRTRRYENPYEECSCLPCKLADGPRANVTRVHDHPPYRPVCNERLVDGQLRGACLNDDGAEPMVDAFTTTYRGLTHTCEDAACHVGGYVKTLGRMDGASGEMGALRDCLEACEPDDDDPITWGQLRRQIAAACDQVAANEQCPCRNCEARRELVAGQ